MGVGCWLVDPEVGGHLRWQGSVPEALGMVVVGGGEGGLAGFVDRLGGAEVHGRWCVPGDPGVVMDIVVLVEEAGAELAGVSE